MDLLGGRTRRVRRDPRLDCPCRGQHPWPQHADNLLDPGRVADGLLDRARIVDIRQPEERAGDPAWIQDLPNVPRERWHAVGRHTP